MIWPDIPFSFLHSDPGTPEFLARISNSFSTVKLVKRWFYGSRVTLYSLLLFFFFFFSDLVSKSSNHGGEGRRVYAGTDDDSRDESSFIRRPIGFSTTAALKSGVPGSLPSWNLIHTEVQVESGMHPTTLSTLEIMRNLGLDRYHASIIPTRCCHVPSSLLHRYFRDATNVQLSARN